MTQYIDHIIYINLEHRTDRREEIERELARMDLTDKAERFEATYIKEQGILGCTISHMEAIRLAKNRGYKNVLILEDDFEFLLEKDVVESRLETFFRSKLGRNYDVCMLCFGLMRESENPMEECDLVKRVIEAQNAAAYIVQEKYYDVIIELYERIIPLLQETKAHWLYANDQAWKNLQEKDRWYHFIERFGKQRAGYSDNSCEYMDYK
jgi:GR25 family glycosyltransferase involved in LPS biosynthesis